MSEDQSVIPESSPDEPAQDEAVAAEAPQETPEAPPSAAEAAADHLRQAADLLAPQTGRRPDFVAEAEPE